MRTGHDTQSPVSDYPSGHHVYGRQAVIYLRHDRDRDAQHTVALEGAFRVDGRADWSQKLVLQLTKYELIGLASVLLGFRHECEYTGRGGTGKGFAAKRQKGSLFVRMWRGTGKQYQVRADPVDVAFWAQLVLGQLGRRTHADGPMVLASLRSYAALVEGSGAHPPHAGHPPLCGQR